MSKFYTLNYGGIMKKLGLTIIVLVLILLGFNNLDAQKERGKFKKHYAGLKELNLSDQQKEKMEEIKFSLAEANIDTEAKLKKNILEIKKLLYNNSFDENELMTLIEKGSNLKLTLKKSRVKMWLDIRNILDDDQKILWAKHFNQLESKRDRITREDRREFKKLGNRNRDKN